jgi:hypothetical protein
MAAEAASAQAAEVAAAAAAAAGGGADADGGGGGGARQGIEQGESRATTQCEGEAVPLMCFVG